jgi:hypothetical protein
MHHKKQEKTMRASLLALALVMLPYSAMAQPDDYGSERTTQSTGDELYSAPDENLDGQEAVQPDNNEFQRSPDKPCDGACN